MVSSQGVSILAAKGSHLGDGPGGVCSLVTCVGRNDLPLIPQDMRLLCGLDIWRLRH